MKANDVPIGDRILPGEMCEKCGRLVEIVDIIGDTVYIACPDSEGDDDHTEHNGQRKKNLIEWGWDLE